MPLGSKYTFTFESVPGIRAALGLDEERRPTVYERLYTQPLSAIYAPKTVWRSPPLGRGGAGRRLEATTVLVAFAVTLPAGSGCCVGPSPLPMWDHWRASCC